jgi:two-component system, OmpR family, alkaline phosphatase synthesis response regulator PhoP
MNNDTIRILLADYDQEALELYREALDEEGYQVVLSSNEFDLKNKAILFRPHLIIMDLMNAEFACFKVSAQLRSNPVFADACFVIFTSMYEEAIQHDSLIGLVDGFIKKPMTSELFKSHVRRFLKRLNLNTTKREILEFSGMSIDVQGYVVRQGSDVIDLAKREFELLLYLASEPKRIFTRNEISRQIWGERELNSGRMLDVYIAKLRNKIGKKHIQTMKGVGYSFVA